VFCFIWHLAGVEQTDAVRSTGTTLFVFGWVAIFGSSRVRVAFRRRCSPTATASRSCWAFVLSNRVCRYDRVAR